MSRGDFGTYGATSASYSKGPRDKESEKFKSLCDSVSGKIFTIIKNVSHLETLSKSVGDEAGKGSETKIHALSQETNKLAKETRNLIKDLSEYTQVGRQDGIDARQGHFKLQQDKLRKEFEKALSRYNTIQNVLSLKMKAHIERETSIALDSSVASNISIDDRKPLIANQRTQQLLMHEEELEVIKERESRLHQIEEDILNVNEIFRDLALLVHQQGETIDSIESHIEKAAVHVDEGNKQLERAKNYQKSARKRLCIIFIVCVVIAIILSLIIYFSVK